MNIVLAWVLFSTASAIGLPRLESDESTAPVSILAVLPGSPAEQAGLKLADEVLELRSAEVSLRIETEQDIREFVDAYRGEEITLLIRRQGKIEQLNATPRVQAPPGEGPLGVALGRLAIERTPLYLAPIEGARTVFTSTVAIISGLWSVIYQLITTGGAPIAVSGPVGIFLFAQDSRVLGIAYFLQFIGILSVNLAILNFLPIPALDGGRVLFLLIEKVKGSRVNPRLEHTAHALGFALLILLILLVTYQDITRVL